jgi:protein-S-isoprenylcysteine O-methyltransferase Ste14
VKRITFELVDTLAFVAVVLCWLLFVLPFLFRTRPPKIVERRRDGASVVGIVVQAAAFSLVWGFRRPLGEPFLESASPWVGVGLDAVAVALGSWAVWMAAAAVVVLGKQWSLAARVVEGHELTTEGPYRFVRHPIYTAMLAMLLASGVVASRWPALLAALAIYVVGTLVRVRSEERLLRETFGASYEAYARRVPAIVPLRFRNP